MRPAAHLSSDDPLLSGFLALLALAIYTGVTVTFFGKRFLDWRFSWSYIIGWVAIILAFAAGILPFVSRMVCHYRSMSHNYYSYSRKIIRQIKRYIDYM